MDMIDKIMEKNIPLLDSYIKFVERSVRIVSHFYFDEDKDFDDVYDIAKKMTNNHFSDCADSLELRTILEEGTSYTNTPFGLVMLLFQQTAEELRIKLMANSFVPKGERIGDIIGIPLAAEASSVPPVARIEENRPGTIKFDRPPV